MPLMATMGITGYLVGILGKVGVPVLPLIVGLLLPHGIIEVPVAILATGAVLNAGASLARPTPGKTTGEVWLEALADWAKIMVGIVAPLLLAASAVEVWVTPRIAMLLFIH
jgi:uncharacterized membrane protein SpoIIM required for sporulation